MRTCPARSRRFWTLRHVFLKRWRGALPEGLPVPVDRQVRGERRLGAAPRQPAGQAGLERLEQWARPRAASAGWRRPSRRGAARWSTRAATTGRAGPPTSTSMNGVSGHSSRASRRTGMPAPPLLPPHQRHQRPPGARRPRPPAPRVGRAGGDRRPAAGEPVVAEERRGLAAARGEVVPGGGEGGELGLGLEAPDPEAHGAWRTPRERRRPSVGAGRRRDAAPTAASVPPPRCAEDRRPGVMALDEARARGPRARHAPRDRGAARSRASAKRAGSSSTRKCSLRRAPRGPRAAALVATTGTPSAMDWSTLFWMPRAMRSGATHTAACR